MYHILHANQNIRFLLPAPASMRHTADFPISMGSAVTSSLIPARTTELTLNTVRRPRCGVVLTVVLVLATSTNLANYIVAIWYTRGWYTVYKYDSCVKRTFCLAFSTFHRDGKQIGSSYAPSSVIIPFSSAVIQVLRGLGVLTRRFGNLCRTHRHKAHAWQDF